MKKNGRFFVITMILVFVTAFSVAGTVNGKNNEKERVEKHYLASIEKEYRQEITDILQKEGYKQSGITMTRVIQDEGMIDYTVKIHHKKLGKLSEIQKQELEKKLKQIDFAVENVSFCHEFL